MTRQLLRARGSWRASLRPEQVVAPPGRPSCPAWLDRDAKAAWEYVASWLEIMGSLAEIDRPALTRYCQAYSRWKRAERFLQRMGETFQQPAGAKGSAASRRAMAAVCWPQVAIAQQLSGTMRQLEREFGLSPKSRLWIDASVLRPAFATERKELEMLASIIGLTNRPAASTGRPAPGSASRRRRRRRRRRQR